MEKQEIRIKGISASPGICIGKAYIVDREGVKVVKQYFVDKKGVVTEVNRFKKAVKQAKDELHDIISNTPEELREHAYILETHMLLVKDKMLYGNTIRTIETEQVNAEWALKKVVGRVKSMFQEMKDEYLKERAADIAHVSDRIMGKLVGAKNVDIASIDKRVILVARDLSPADTSQIRLERVKGFVTDLGGRTSHTGIIAKTLGIPAVLGLTTATDQIYSDDIIIVDGIAGVVIVHPLEATLVEYEDKKVRFEAYRASISRGSRKDARTTDEVHVVIMGNIELPEEVVSVIDNGGDGIGLYRTEFQYLSRSAFPTEDELFDKYKDVVEVMEKKPVTIRTLDINGDKAVSYTGCRDELNPALGLRGIRYCLKKPDIFKTQLRAILRAAAYGNVRILFPMISGLAELVEAKRLLDCSAEELEKEKVPYNRDVKVGIMIEVPSAVIIADILAEEADFFSLGTNDLIQYTLAIDRGNQDVADLFNPLHPAIIRMLKQISDVAKATGTPLFMCGEMASEPLYMPILLGLGLDELSMNPQAIPTAKNVVRSISAGESAAFLPEVLKQKRASDLVHLVTSTYGSLIPEIYYNH